MNAYMIYQEKIYWILEWEATMRKYGYGKCNDREALLEFAVDNDMVICNTLFQQKECRK